jgi:predicted TIM-barrel fold metal-dependent hydrolase
LALSNEEAIEPDLQIVDSHFHFIEYPEYPYLTYLLRDFERDLVSGHRIVAAVHVEGRVRYQRGGAQHLAPVGETEFVANLARSSRSPTRIAAGIVANADLTMGDKVVEIFEAHLQAAPEFLRGIRHVAPWDDDPALHVPAITGTKELFLAPSFRRGFARLAEFDLSFDAWLYSSQLDELVSLAMAFPDVRIVVDFAQPIRYGVRLRDPDAEFERWRHAVGRIAQLPNVWLKHGGIGMPIGGFGFAEMDSPPSSAQIVARWTPYFDVLIEAFGPDRCMFGSNFPVDRGAFSYATFWNACKLMTRTLSASERHNLFSGNATDFYRL